MRTHEAPCGGAYIQINIYTGEPSFPLVTYGLYPMKKP